MPLSCSDDAIRLATRLAASLTPEQRAVLFTGTADGQVGVSTVAAEVAVAFARTTHQPVAIIDARDTDPSLHQRFDVRRDPGLTDVLGGTATLETALSKVADGVAVLPIGRPCEDFLGLCGRAAVEDLLKQLRQQCRLVIIDALPLLTSASASLLASRADGVVAVVADGRSHRGDVVEIKRVLDGLKVSLIGAVLATGLDETPAPPRGRWR